MDQTLHNWVKGQTMQRIKLLHRDEHCLNWQNVDVIFYTSIKFLRKRSDFLFLQLNKKGQ